MKNLIVLFAGEMTGFALETLAGGDSAFVRSLGAASRLCDDSGILVCTATHRNNGSPAANPSELKELQEKAGISSTVVWHNEEKWNPELFFTVIDRNAGAAEQVFIVFADAPFMDTSFSKKLFEQHRSYAAEYTFADGYPVGLSPDILARGIVPVLARLASGETGPVKRTIVFDTVKKDINSFDIETDIAPVDVRHMRMVLACDTWQNTLVCRNFQDITAENYANLLHARPGKLRTVPAFYGIQIAGGCPFVCEFCPYPEKSEKGIPGQERGPVTGRSDTMSSGDFSRLIRKIADYSKTAVISLSLWGEPSRNPQIAEFVSEILQYPGLSVLLETTGIGWKSGTIDAVAQTVKQAAGRTTSFPPVTWIVSLDAAEAGLYGKLRGMDKPETANTRYTEALECIELLAQRFPGDVWPQFIRMNENEEQLEKFYRFWKEKLSRVIVQKHDSFCGTIPDRRVADLSPLKRTPCWHLRRDMSILIDGTVPLCREDPGATSSFGNAFSDDLATIWNGYHSVYEQHAACVYEGICGACDEYYTYNF